MSYSPPVKGIYLKKSLLPKRNSIASDVGSVAILVNELRALRDDLIRTTDRELEKVEQTGVNNTKLIQNKINEIDGALKSFHEKVEVVIEQIKAIKTIQGNPGKDSDDEYIIEKLRIDEENITNRILAKIPKALDESMVVSKVLKRLPENKASLKIIKEQMEVDPMSIIDKIMELPIQKKRNKMIDGMEQTVRAMQSQLARGYLHGSGIPSLTEGSGITLTKTSDGGYAVSVAGSSTIYTETPTGAIDSNNKVYTTLHDITSVITFAINGQYIHRNEYTILNNTITFISALDSSLSGKEFDIVYK